MDKHAALRQLAEVRRATRWLGYAAIGDFHDGIYECDFVSPYTKSAGNLDAELMVLLQDWASEDALNGAVRSDRVALGRDAKRRTNVKLEELLERHFGLALSDVYATNVFPFVKPAAMGSSLPQRDLNRAAVQFGLPQIKIVRPVVAVCLGGATFSAVSVAAGRKAVPTVAAGVANPFLLGDTEVWCQAHPSDRGINSRNNVVPGQVDRDWDLMAQAFQRRRRTRLPRHT